MTIKEAGMIEVENHAEYVIPPYILETCQVCGNQQELRAGVCFACQYFCETDRRRVWLKDNPNRSWPYVWSTGWIIARSLLRHQKG